MSASSRSTHTAEGPGIQPVVVGTAGHIDHGKSTLVRALTGIDPDRLKEEKERGLTIDLGFARFALPDGRLVGIVDVPGHERFIRNMVAGASGIDLVVLVVAADDGVMPQTREHLQIMQLLGVERGLIALTKVELVDADIVELAALDVRELCQGTFLEEAPLFPLDALSGRGLEEFRSALHQAALEVVPRTEEGVFRMPVQRVFTKRGFGTVVTGIPVGGSVAVGDALEVLPGRLRGKVRGIQAYGGAAQRARAGHSTALNLSDVEHGQVERGCVVATPNFFAPARMLGARFHTLPSLARPIENRTPIRLHVGTAGVPGEVVLLDQEVLVPGATGLVQLRLEEPVVTAPGDRFVLRLLSPEETLGGGVVLEESRHRLKRFKGFVLEELSHTEESLDEPAALTEAILARRRLELLGDAELAQATKRSPADQAQLLARLAGEGRVVRPGSAKGWMHVDRFEEALSQLLGTMESWFEEHPLRTSIDVRTLRSALSMENALFSGLVEEAGERGHLVPLPGGMVQLAGRTVEMDAESRALLEKLVATLAKEAFQPPTQEELPGLLGAPAERIQALLELLVDEGRVVHVGADLFVEAPAIERAEKALVANFERNGELKIPELRDELGTTRKFLIPLLEYFDAAGVTIRQGSHRVLKRR